MIALLQLRDWQNQQCRKKLINVLENIIILQYMCVKTTNNQYITKMSITCKGRHILQQTCWFMKVAEWCEIIFTKQYIGITKWRQTVRRLYSNFELLHWLISQFKHIKRNTNSKAIKLRKCHMQAGTVNSRKWGRHERKKYGEAKGWL